MTTRSRIVTNRRLQRRRSAACVFDRSELNGNVAGIWSRQAGRLKSTLAAVTAWATEVVRREDPDRPFPVHQWLLVRHGIYNIENLDLEELARRQGL